MTASPLDELRIDADKVWDVIAPGYELADGEIEAMVRHERAARESWMKKSRDKSIKREEAKAEKEDVE
jgi:hypothetical protein